MQRWSPQIVQSEQTEEQFLEVISGVDARISPPFSDEQAGQALAVPDEGDFLEQPPTHWHRPLSIQIEFDIEVNPGIAGMKRLVSTSSTAYSPGTSPPAIEELGAISYHITTYLILLNKSLEPTGTSGYPSFMNKGPRHVYSRIGFPRSPLCTHSVVKDSLSSDLAPTTDLSSPSFLGWTLLIIFDKVSPCQPFNGFIFPLPQFFVVSLWHFPMAAIEENPLQPLPPPNTFEEDRALLLQTHRTWRRSQQSEVTRKPKPGDDQASPASPPRSQDFFQVDLREGDFRHQDLRNANFQEAYLPGANFAGADLRGANFQGANLRSVRFTGAQLAWANFSQADLIWADFQQADLQGTDFQQATLRGATFVRAQIHGGNFLSTDCSWADFREADLNESDFQRANLNGTTFLNANTATANFQGSLGQHELSATDDPPPHDDQLFS